MPDSLADIIHVQVLRPSVCHTIVLATYKINALQTCKTWPLPTQIRKSFSVASDCSGIIKHCSRKLIRKTFTEKY